MGGVAVNFEVGLTDPNSFSVQMIAMLDTVTPITLML